MAQLTKLGGRRSGLMVSALVSRSSGLGSSPGWGHCAVVLGRHFTLTVPLSTQVYKWVPANLMPGDNPTMDQHPIQGGVEILLIASCYRNWDKLRPDQARLPAAVREMRREIGRNRAYGLMGRLNLPYLTKPELLCDKTILTVMSFLVCHFSDIRGLV